MRRSVAELQQLCNDILQRNGLSEEDAHIVADILIEAELRGRSTHGLARLPGIVHRVRHAKRRPMKLARDGGAYALIDGQDNLGYLVAHRCARTVIRKGDQTGIGIVGGYNTTHSGMLGYYTTMIADAGLIGLAMCDTSPRMVPWGATEAVLGSNPISAGFPAGKGQVIVDLSCAAVTNGQLMLAMKDGTPIPDGCALGPDGHLTTDPQMAREGAALPFGGHKGYALSLMVQILSSALVRASVVPERGSNYGLLMIAISPSIFLDPRFFRTGVEELIERIKSARKAEGVGEILIPGERSFRLRETQLRDGIELDKDLNLELADL